MGGIEANARRQDDDHSGCDFEAASMLPLLVEDGDHLMVVTRGLALA